MKTPVMIALTAALAAMLGTSPAAAQVQFTTLYNFTGEIPTGLALIGGALYGVTADTACGNVFELRPPAAPGEPWTLSVLYTFAGTPGDTGDACSPAGPLIRGAKGTLFGLTQSGGANGYGAMYELQPPASPGAAWAESVAYSFNSEPYEGAGPLASLLVNGPEGSFYVLCGYADGSLLQLLAPAAPVFTWTGALLSEIGNGADSLIAAAHGSLYGTTAFGGEAERGSVFQLAPPRAPGGAWTQTEIYSFNLAADNPNMLTLASDGTIYGTTYGTVPGWYAGIGEAYALTPPASPGQEWTYTALRSFPSAHPDTQLVLHNGNLYGALENPEGGAVFELQPPATPGGAWTTIFLHQFTNGQVPLDPLIVDQDGTIFGITGSLNSPPPATGTIFKIATGN